MDNKVNKQEHDKPDEQANDNKKYWFTYHWYRVWPITWQGWLLLLGFMGMINLLSFSHDVLGIPLMVVGIVITTIIFTTIFFKKAPPFEW